MNITKKYIEDFGCKKEFDLFGSVYYSFEEGHFYAREYDEDKWAYHVVDIDIKDGSKCNYEVINTTEEFEKKYL